MTWSSSEAVLRFRALIGNRLGLHFADDRLDQLRDVLRAKAAEHGGVEHYLTTLSAARSDGRELRVLAADLTVSETYFFRNIDQFRALEEHVLPSVAAAAQGRPLRILSAGSATGEEAYSIAITVHELRRTRMMPEVEIVGIDVNHRVIQKARRAHYSPWALRGTPERIRREYFARHGRELALREDIAAAVRFEERNLLVDDPQFWRPELFDVVFFRNTFMYFAHDVAAAVIGRVSRALVPGGFLFVGHAETLRGLSDDYDLNHSHETFYYRKRGTTTAPVVSPVFPPRPAPELPPDFPTDGRWVSDIGDASARIARVVDEALSPASVAAPVQAPAPPSSSRTAAPPLASALALLADERFADALEVIDGSGVKDADALLLRAVVLTNLGRYTAAAAACDAVLRADPLSAGAHFLLGLSASHAADDARARRHHEAAIYLDPAFAMPQLHLGILARRAGDTATARHHLANAADRLRREDASRLLLFGGGFTREALLRLCEAELKHVTISEGRRGR